MKYNFTKKQLKDLYSKNEKSLTQIGLLLNVPSATICDYLKKYNIPRRTPAEGIRLRFDIIGKQFGRWEVLKYYSKKIGYYICQCECGIKKPVRRDGLTNGRSKSCGCLQKEICKKLNAKNHLITQLNQLYLQYKFSAKKRKMKFTLSKKQFKSIISEPCYYCNLKPSNIRKNKYNDRKFIYSGIDRINNKEGYILNNCVPCCKICNFAKRIMSLQEFIDWSKRLFKHIAKIEIVNKKRRKR